MLKRVATIGVWLILLVPVVVGFFVLKNACSFEGPLPKLEAPLKQQGTNDNAKHSNAGQQRGSPEGEQSKPTATFDLRVTEPHKIEGRYYAEKEDKEDWGHKFFCDIKIGEVLLAIFTLFLVLYTARLYSATAKLAEADRPHMLISELSARGITSPPNEDGMVTVLLEHKFMNYGRSPAFLRNFCMKYTTDELSGSPAYERREPTRFIIAVNSWYGSLVPSELKIDGAAIREMLLGNKKLYIYGRIEYTGIGSITHVHRFAYWLVFENSDASVRFYPGGPDSYWENT